MIPHMKLWQRIVAWLLFKLESRNGWGAGFDADDADGERWLLLDNDHACMSYSYALMRDYHYVRAARKNEVM